MYKRQDNDSCEYQEGCMDSTSLNYDPLAKFDDGSCIYASDKLVGSWNVEETVEGVTTIYTAEIVRIDNDSVSIVYDNPDFSVYHFEQLDVHVYWNSSELGWKEPTPFSGNAINFESTIINENDFTINYYHYFVFENHDVSQHFTR